MTQPVTEDELTPSAVTTTFGLDGDVNELAAHVGIVPASYTLSRDVSTKTVTLTITGK